MNARKIVAALLIIALCAAAGCTGTGGSTNTATPPANGQLLLYNCTCEQKTMLVNTRQDAVLCTVCASQRSDDIYLYFNDEPIAPMNDAGLNGDAAAGDGIYSCQIDVQADDYEETMRIYAQAGTARSNTENLYAVKMPTRQRINQMKEVMKSLESLHAQHAGAEKSLDAAEQYVKKLVKNKVALEYTRDADNVSAVLACGLTIVFQPLSADTLSVGGGAEVEIRTFEPFYTQLRASGIGEYADRSARNIDDAFANFHFSDASNVDEGRVTRDVIRSFGANQLILWRGHGGFNSDGHSYLITGEKIDEERLRSDSSYYNELVADGLLVMSDGRIAFTGKYVRKHCGSMKNSVLFLGACKSGYDDVLARAFLNKGAVTVFGYSDTVSAYYADGIEGATLEYWSKIDPRTDKYYMLGDALALAKEEWGADDSAYTVRTNNAAPMLFGEAALRLADMGGADANNANAGANGGSNAGNAGANGGSGANTGGAADTNENAHAAYRQLLEAYAWVADCPSDLSELSPADYGDVWLGEYALFDMDGDGRDELIILAGQSMADMSCTFYTCTGGAARCTGSLMCGEISFFVDDAGKLALEYTRGEFCAETHLNLTGGAVAVTATQTRDAAQVPQGRAYLETHNVHDLSPLG